MAGKIGAGKDRIKNKNTNAAVYNLWTGGSFGSGIDMGGFADVRLQEKQLVSGGIKVMAYFDVDIAGLKQYPPEFEEVAVNLQDLDRQLTISLQVMADNFSETVNVQDRLEEYIGYLHRIAERIQKLSDNLKIICERYEYYEERAAEGVAIEIHGSNANNMETSILEGAGFFGNGLEIGRLVSSEINHVKQKDYVDAMDDFIGVGKHVYDTTDSVVDKYHNLSKAQNIMSKDAIVKNGLKSAFGLDDYYNAKQTLGSASKAKDVSARWYNNYKKAEYKELSGIKKSGVIFEAISGGISNYKECKSGEISAGRAVLETLGETAVGVVKNAGVGAVAGAAVATVFGGAPVLAVAGVSFLINAGLDKMAEKITGGKKNFTELVSDTCLDVGMYIGDVITGTRNIMDDSKAMFFDNAAKENQGMALAEMKGITPCGNYKFSY